jgi:hypothetical protein
MTAVSAIVIGALGLLVSILGWVLPAFVGYQFYLNGNTWGGLGFFFVVSAFPPLISIPCSFLAILAM